MKKNKKILVSLLFILSFSGIGRAQSPEADSLQRLIKITTADSLKVKLFTELGRELMDSDVDQSIKYLEEAIVLASKINAKSGLALAYNIKGRALAQQGNIQEAILVFNQSLEAYKNIKDQTGVANILSNLGSMYFITGNSGKALELHFQSLKIAKELDNKLRIGTSYNNIGTVYQNNNATEAEALDSYKKALVVFQEIDHETGIATAAMNIGEVYFFLGNYDSAIYYHQMALTLCDGTIDATFPLTQLGEIFGARGDYRIALNYHQRALEISERMGAKFELTESLIGYANTQKRQGDATGAINTLERAKKLAKEIDARKELEKLYEGLSTLYASSGNYKAAYQNELDAKAVKEEIAKLSTEQKIRQLQFDFELNQKQAEIEFLKKDKELKDAAVLNQRVIIFAALGALFTFIFISIFLFRNNLNKQKANKLLQAQKEEIYAQRERVEYAYDQLKSTQAQLIQSEKMASLGELTAGIAHEIQNPLNFVNNFSEVSKELLSEMKDELAVGNLQLANELASDVEENLDKIHHHGKRADAIVKGMLQHSRSSSGQKELTDINALSDEYFRLAYHGMKAKDPLFNASFHFEADDSLPLVNVVPQEMGRVLLNLINNAFQAVAEKQKAAGANYNPEVRVSTKLIFPPADSQAKRREGTQFVRGAEISVKDNGAGIPDSIKDKIFQPFFTTKPTGQGTGLGLSLSYDIVKAHGGELKMETKEDVGSQFIIQLPVN